MININSKSLFLALLALLYRSMALEVQATVFVVENRYNPSPVEAVITIGAML